MNVRTTLFGSAFRSAHAPHTFGWYFDVESGVAGGSDCRQHSRTGGVNLRGTIARRRPRKVQVVDRKKDFGAVRVRTVQRGVRGITFPWLTARLLNRLVDRCV